MKQQIDEWISQQPGVSQLLVHTWAHPRTVSFFSTALRSRSGRSIINGNWAIDRPGKYEGGGTMFTYKRPNEISSTAGESFLAEGPTNEILDVYVSLNYCLCVFLLLRTTLRKLKQQRLPQLNKIIWVVPFGVPLHAWCSSLPLTSQCTQFIETINSPRCLLPSAFTDPVKPILLVESNQRQNISFISWALDLLQALSSYANLACFLFMAKESKCLKQDKTTHSSQPSSNSIKASEETRTPESSAWHSKAWSNNIEIY